MGADMLNRSLFICEIFAKIRAVFDSSTSIDLAFVIGGPGMANAGSYSLQLQGAKHSCLSQGGSRHFAKTANTIVKNPHFTITTFLHR